MIDPTDVIALVFMALFSIRRIELRRTDPRAFPGVPRAAFDEWFRAAAHARTLSVNACFLKFILNTAWFYGFRSHVTAATLVRGGMLVFFGWLLLLAYSFWLGARARRRASELGIVIGRRLVEETATGRSTGGAPGGQVSEGESGAGAASSRGEADA